MDHAICFHSATVAMAEAAFDHTDVVGSILVVATAITIGLSIEVLTFLDCVVVCDDTDYSVGLITSFPELTNHPGIIEDLLSDIDFIRVEIDWLVTVLKNLLNGQWLELLPMLQRYVLLFRVNLWDCSKNVFYLLDLIGMGKRVNLR